MKTVEEISKLLTIARAAGLDVSACDKLTPEEIAKLYNGIGPESFPEFLREEIDEVLHIFEAGAMEHDVDFSQGDGSVAKFAAANDKLKSNCLKLANYFYPWYSRKRYRARAVARLMAIACEKYGWSAYLSAN